MAESTQPTELSELDRAILRQVQGTLPDSATPFADIAAATGATEAHVLTLLARMADSGEIRRFGATLKHQKAGYGANVMVAWYVDDADIERMGLVMAARPEISHCYQRINCLEWPYNLYTMVHGKTAEACKKVVEELVADTGLDDYAMLFSIRELKKTSMQYF